MERHAVTVPTLAILSPYFKCRAVLMQEMMLKVNTLQHKKSRGLAHKCLAISALLAASTPDSAQNKASACSRAAAASACRAVRRSSPILSMIANPYWCRLKRMVLLSMCLLVQLNLHCL